MRGNGALIRAGAFAAAMACGLVSRPLSAATVVIPTSIYSAGSNKSFWATEIRVTNHTANDLSFRVVDFVGSAVSLRFVPASYSVPAGQTRALGAYNLISPIPCIGIACWVGLGVRSFGAFEVDVDDGITLEAAILSGVAPIGTGVPAKQPCSSWQGGYISGDGIGSCNEGAGPLLQGVRGYFAAGSPISLSWLHTQPTRRTNVTLYNPDHDVATVTLSVISADAASTVTETLFVAAHSYAQLNDLFASSPFDEIRAHNGDTTAAARATLTSTTRLYAIGWVISNQNNTFTISEPR